MNGREVKSRVKVHIARFNLRELRLLLNVVIQLKFRKKKGWQVLVGHQQGKNVFNSRVFFFLTQGNWRRSFWKNKYLSLVILHFFLIKFRNHNAS
jgi:hypothetical protein